MPGQVKLKGQGFWTRPLTPLAEHHTALVVELDHRKGSHRQLDLAADLLTLLLQSRILEWI